MVEYIGFMLSSMQLQLKAFNIRRCLTSRACSVNETHQRFTSGERRLWWNIDRDAVNVTGCVMPCEYTVYEAKEVPYEDGGSGDHDYVIQVTN